MNIKVIGTGCEKCDALYKNVQNAIKELDIDAEIEKVEDLIDIVNDFPLINGGWKTGYFWKGR